MKKFLLLGSAGYIVDWYAKNGRAYLDAGYILCAMNNAWAVDPNNLKMWFRSEDFFLTPNCKVPTQEQRDKFAEIVKVLDAPFFYRKGRGGGTMFLNVAYHLLNHSFYDRQAIWIAVAGCDMNYSGSNVWFYGKGQPDPLRSMGEELLGEELTNLKILSEQQGCTICNVGGQEMTRLPFCRYRI